MRKRIVWLLALLFLWFGIFSPAQAAQPFSAPAVFDFNGSTMDFAIAFDLGRLGSYDLGLDPNPASVTGFIDINKVSTLTGVCQGRLREISASTDAEISKGIIKLDFTVTATLNAESLDGIFLWSKDKAAFYPDSLVLTLSFDSESWDIPLSGIPLPATYKNGVLTLDADVKFSEEYEGYTYNAVIGLHLRGVLQNQGSGNGALTIDLALDKNLYQPGDRLQLRAGLNNGGEERQVDIYVAFFDHEDNYFFAPDYTSTMTPLTSVRLDAGQYTALTKILDVLLPSHTPPIVAAGNCSFCAVVTAAGSKIPISNLACVDFTYGTSSQSGNYSFDGEWRGTGGSAVPGGECPALATVRMTIVNSQISGEADEAEETEYDESYRMTGSVNAKGEVLDGVLLEDYMGVWYPVGSYAGTFSGTTFSGTWMDQYGCYGTLMLEKLAQ